MASEVCDYHVNLVADIAVIKTDIRYIKDKVCNHVTEGEGPGGWRDRLVILEQEVKVLRSGIWKIGLASGVIGALVGNATPEVIKLIAKLLKVI
ncbi:MAG: hypothetical protein Q8O36_03020 [Candidatus Omnitrophota bacterium]|nr:hypothetical protein [Candidatus Omnitrophota bacterium]